MTVTIQTLKERITQYRDNALRNATHQNDLADQYMTANRPDLATTHNRRATEYLAQLDAYQDVLNLLKDEKP